jgi:hypothetical protein
VISKLPNGKSLFRFIWVVYTLAKLKITTSNRSGIYQFKKRNYVTESEFLEWSEVI